MNTLLRAVRFYLLSSRPGPAVGALVFAVAGSCLYGLSPAHALPRSTVAGVSPAAVAARAKPRAALPRTPSTEALRALPVVTAPGAGQTGYVHYWVLTAPNGEEEIQVGIELPDGRMAWAFPELGVQVVDFIAEGRVDAHGRMFRVQHLYGLRPFADEGAMHVLRENLEKRLASWINDETAYCFSGTREREICLSCMGLVMQLLFPGRSPAHPAIPRDFPRIGGDLHYTTEDLLLYMVRLHELPNGQARRQRITIIGGPPSLQEELTRLSEQFADDRKPVVADTGRPPQKRRISTRPPAPKPLVRRPAG